ncbi:uncharacterized protein LOC134270936 isoform X2 [Saccostrea cucullata]|uniref:uncharacterized protein LOC134270936 isoform X2 n=1 Tax=Saccostrea cuccullata TaxID=36930 RepID=UPI002ED4C7CA
MSSIVVTFLLLTMAIQESLQQPRVDGGWSSWSNASCSVTCGRGSIIRLRSCTNPEPQNGGKYCDGVPFERKECFNKPCPVNGGWSPWTPYGECTATCGLAFHTSTRTCDNPAPQNGGKPCEGNSTDTQPCRGLPLCAIDGNWSKWTSYSECSVKCGNGTRTRTRSCNDPPPQYGGLDCAGNASESINCTANECPVDGGWSSWISTGKECSVQCGRGSKIRIRTCTNPAPQNGGRDCPGSEYESTSCMLKECPVNGGWTLWSPYSTCTATCGVGYQTSTRTCTNPSPRFGGQPCPGKSNDTRICQHLPLCPVNGEWSTWSPFSECSLTCGTGIKERTRSCTNPAPENEGLQCNGSGSETAPCNSGQCIELTTFSSTTSRSPAMTSTPDLNPVNGGWSSWSNASCSVTCGTGSIIRLRFCSNPEPKNGGKYCEGIPFSRQTCSNGPCPVNGGWSPWTPYGECTATCGLAFHTSTRTCNNPAPQNGGKPCEGNSTDTQPCRGLPLCAINGGWSPWMPYGECTATCGLAFHTFTRTCDNPAPQNGGEPCKGNDTDIQPCRGMPLCPETTVEPTATRTTSDHQKTTTLSALTTSTIIQTSTPSETTIASTHFITKTTTRPTVTSSEKLKTTVLHHQSTTESLPTRFHTSTTTPEYSSAKSQKPSSTSSQTSPTTISQRPSTTISQRPSTTISQSSSIPHIGVIMVSFAVYIDKSFDDKLLDHSSDLYKETTQTAQKVLTDRFKETRGFLMVIINSFSYGSIRVNYTVSVDGTALVTEKDVDQVHDQLITKATQWTDNEPVFFGFPVNVDKTRKDVKTRDIKNELLNKRNIACTCPTDNSRCDFSEGRAICRNLCLDLSCGKHGTCFVDTKTKLPKCFCKQSNDSKFVYLGEKCEKTEVLKDDDKAPDNMTMISITAGVGGGLMLFIIIAFICVCRKVHEQKKLLVSQSSLSLNNLEQNTVSKSNFYFNPNTTHNPLYKESEEEKLKSNSEQIVRIFLHVAPEKHRSYSMHSMTSINTNGDDQNVYMEGSHIQPIDSSMIVPNSIHQSSERPPSTIATTQTGNEADRQSVHRESNNHSEQEELS